jgi:hypothetical protein
MGAPTYPAAPYSPYWGPPTEPKPTTAFALSLVAGILILLGGIFELWLGYLTSTIVFSNGFNAFFGVLGAVGVSLGALVLVAAVLLDRHPEHHTVLGVVILVLSIVSVVAYAGFVLGFVLGIVGGVLAIAWTPTRWVPNPYGAYAPVGWAPPAPASPAVGQRVCLRCGRVVPPDSRFCAYCGNALPP